MAKVTHRGDLDGHTLSVNGQLCIDSQCNFANNGSKYQFKFQKNFISGFQLTYNPIVTLVDPQPVTLLDKLVTFDIQPGSCVAKNKENNIILETSITINIDQIGVNGLSNGDIIPNAWYNVYIIANSDRIADYPVAGLIVYVDDYEIPLETGYLGNTLLPTGYDIYRRIGTIRTISSGISLQPAYVCPFTQTTKNDLREYNYDIDKRNLQFLNNGLPKAWTRYDFSNFAPFSVNSVKIVFEFRTSSVEDLIGIRPILSSSGDPIGTVISPYEPDDIFKEAPILIGPGKITGSSDAIFVYTDCPVKIEKEEIIFNGITINIVYLGIELIVYSSSANLLSPPIPTDFGLSGYICGYTEQL